MENEKEDTFLPGDIVITRLKGERAIVIGEIDKKEDELGLGTKLLIKHKDGRREPVFACELDSEE